MKVDSLDELLRQEQYGECRDVAEILLRHGALGPAEKAVVFWALSRSLTGLHAYQEAVGPGELAAHFSRESHQYDLLGKTLVHLGSLHAENQLHKRALACLADFFRYITLYSEAKALEGRVFYLIALCHEALGQCTKALEYSQKAYRWLAARRSDPQILNGYRAALAWRYLQVADPASARPLLAESDAYLEWAPNDLDARAQLLNSQACLALLTGDHQGAVDAAVQVARLRGVYPGRKARAFLTLHATAKAMGLTRIALGLGMLAKIQATLARLPEVEEEVSRSMLQMQQRGGLPYMEELCEELIRRSRNCSTGQCPVSVE